ncbi:BPL-N domain-containing protein [Psychrobacter sp. 1U2]|uniref:BPL-N domain-containing protein n=1 Tax=Psychrobacter sp. 1U2 TaxID=3453577 RepID=UPI003F45B641
MNFMINHSITVWVYADEGTSELSVQSALVTIKKKLSKGSISSVQTLSSQDIINNKLNDELSESRGIGVLVMPGGADLPYCQNLNGQGNDNVREFISKGNIYIGICAGGYYGAKEIQFSGQSYELGHKRGYEINGARELALFSGTAIGSVSEFTDGQLYDETIASKAMVTLDYANEQQGEVYYHGGAYFIADKEAEFNVVATYDNGKNAIVSGNFGQGKYLLSGVHFELSAEVYERYAVKEASVADVEREQCLLAAISREDYGKLVYQEIARLVEAADTSE